MMIMAVVPLLVLGQEAGSDEGDDGAAPKADAAEGFAPYQTILDRLPFGPLPPNFNPDAPPGTPPGGGDSANGPNAGEEELSEDEQQIVASVRVSILNVTPSGVTAVGFTDSSVQPPVHYYMKVGEKRDVWEVKEADPAEQTVVLLKNGVEATLKVGEGVAGGDNKKKAASARPMPLRGLVRINGREGGDAPFPRMSAMERLRARRRQSDEDLKAEEARREAAVAEARKDAAKAAAEREQQREALLQIQEELRRQREEREQRAAQEAQEKPQEDAAAVEQ